MYNRIFNFFFDNNLIYSLQFGSRQKYSTVHALISLTENTRKNLDEGNIGGGIFVDLRKHLILFNMIFFYQSLNIVVCVVLQMNGLNCYPTKESLKNYEFSL